MRNVESLPIAIVASFIVIGFVFWFTMTGQVTFEGTSGNITSNAPKEVNQSSTDSTEDLFETKISQEVISSYEFMQHNKPNDCWVIQNKKIYNYSSYAPNHNQMQPYCGKLEFEQRYADKHNSNIANLNNNGVFIGILE